MKAYTLYFYSPNKSCILYFTVDGKSKARALKMGKAMAALMLEYYQLLWPSIDKITVEVEEYKEIKPSD